MKICLVSIIASHYRRRIYQLIDNYFSCTFIFGKENTTIRQLDLNMFNDAIEVPNVYINNTNWYYQPQLGKITKQYNIIINDLGIFCLSSWLILMLAKFRKQKVYHWDHGWYGRESFIKKWVKRLYFGLADGAFIYGNYARNLMIKNGFNPNKLHVIHNSLDYDEQLTIRNNVKLSTIYSNHFGNSFPVICFIGRLTPIKKLDLIIEAMHLLKIKGEDYNLVLIGSGNEKEKLHKKVVEYSLENQVWFYGPCYDEKENAELIFNSDLCVSPGNVGLTAMHTMMFGCPVITHDCFEMQMPEFEAIKENVTGAFFKNDDVESLAKAISNWFSTKLDKREVIRKYCFSEIDNNWNPHCQLDIIRDVLNFK